MTNEFHTLNGVCSNLVPQGPGYENITIDNQVCTTVGALPGESHVSGSRFVLLSYGFKQSNTWMVCPSLLGNRSLHVLNSNFTLIRTSVSSSPSVSHS